MSLVIPTVAITLCQMEVEMGSSDARARRSDAFIPRIAIESVDDLCCPANNSTFFADKVIGSLWFGIGTHLCSGHGNDHRVTHESTASIARMRIHAKDADMHMLLDRNWIAARRRRHRRE